MKIKKDIIKYTAPARGSKAWKHLYKKKTAKVYLKEFFQLNNVRYRSSERANIHFDMATLIYNASKLAVDRINSQVQKHSQVA